MYVDIGSKNTLQKCMYVDIGSKIPCKYVCVFIKYFPQEKKMCV